MRGALSIYRRELAGLFLSPLAWVVLLVAYALQGWLFVGQLESVRGEVVPAFEFIVGGSIPFWVLIALVPPLLTMRMISEESRTGMIEFLLTAPVRDWAVIAGKFAAAWTVMAVLWLVGPIDALLVHSLGTDPEWPRILGGYLGSVLTSGLFCALGLLFSALTSTPLLAAYLGMVTNLALLVAPFLVASAGSEWLGAIVQPIDVIAHFQSSFLIGVFDTGVVAFFIVWSAAFLFLSTRVLEARRWM